MAFIPFFLFMCLLFLIPFTLGQCDKKKEELFEKTHQRYVQTQKGEKIKVDYFDVNWGKPFYIKNGKTVYPTNEVEFYIEEKK